ncbi:MAG: BMP family ABC transporter substrate-binding protein [Actinomycetota bacterium]
MTRRRANTRLALLTLLALLTACGGGTATGADDAAADPPAQLAVSDIVDTAAESAATNEPLDDLCRRVFVDAPFVPELTVGLVADVASIDDGTFNQAAFEGMEAAGRCFGVATTFLESAGDDAAAQIASMVDAEVDIVITVGFQFQEATLDAAADRPDVRFIGVDQGNEPELANYVAISFRDDQVGFLAGAMAGLLTESNIVAVIAGPETIPPVVAIADGFEAGARLTRPGVVVLRRHLDSFVDGPVGADQAAAFVEDGADVVFGAAGESGAWAIRTAAASGAAVIGVDQDEYFTTFAGGAEAHADGIVTSAIKRVDLGVFLTIAAMASGEVSGGGFVLDATNGGVTYAPFHEADIAPEVAGELERIRRQLATGELVPMADGDAGEASDPAAGDGASDTDSE